MPDGQYSGNFTSSSIAFNTNTTKANKNSHG